MSSAELDRATTRAVDHCLATQQENGCWVADPDPRITETALAAIALAQSQDTQTRELAWPARRWLRTAEPQRHHPAAEAFEAALRSLALYQDDEIDLTGSAFADPVVAARSRVLQVIAGRLGVPVAGGTPVDQLRAEIARAVVTAVDVQLKPWSQAELLSAQALLAAQAGDHGTTQGTAILLAGHQAMDGSFYQNPISTALAFLALDTVAPGTAAWRAARHNLERGQHADGTWRFCSSDVWDTTLTLRAFGDVPGFDPVRRERATAFLYAAQNDDGGWPFRSGVESDNDTTAAALLALDPEVAPFAVINRAIDYLARRRTDEGLWRTWQFRDDPPVEDVVAHVVAGLDRHRSRHDIALGPARRWLVGRWRAEGRWTAGWYRGLPYATTEVGAALPGDPVLAEAARALAATQNSDGGWPAEAGGPSTASSTGLALAVLAQPVAPDAGDAPDGDPCARGARYLLESQHDDGTWPGQPEMCGPRPLLSHFQTHTQAFTMMGLNAARARQPVAG